MQDRNTYIEARGSLARALFASFLALAAASCGDAQEVEEFEPPAEIATAPVPDYSASQPGPRTGDLVGPLPCNAPAAANFIGEDATPENRAALAEAVAPVTRIRWVSPGMQADPEGLDPERLNVMLDTSNTITSVECG